MVTDSWQADLRRCAGHGDQSTDCGGLVCELSQTTLLAALEREVSKVQVSLGCLACDPEEGHLLGPAHDI